MPPSVLSGLLISSCFFQAFQVPQDHQDHQVQAQLKETGVTPASQASLAPLAEKENLEAQEAPELLVLPDLKVGCSARCLEGRQRIPSPPGS